MTLTVNGNNNGNMITIADATSEPNPPGYTISGSGFTISPPGSPPPFTNTELVINTANASSGGPDVVDLNGLTTNSGVMFTSIAINGGGGTQNVTGSQFDETISTGGDSDTINAGAGNDTITGGTGADSMDGGAGNDTFQIGGLEASGDTFIGGADNDTIFATGTLTLTSFGPAAGGTYTTTGTYAGIETFDGKGFTINGVNNGIGIIDFSGFTTVTNLGTINTADATGGFDYVNVSTSTAGVTINGGGGIQIIVGSDFNDTIDGKSDNDSITGGGGDDIITGGSGSDVMDGGSGNDTFNVSGNDVGGDTFIGGDGTDTIKNTASAGLSMTSFGPTGSGTAATYSSIETLDGNSQAINGSNATNEVVNLSLIGQVLNVTGVNMADGADTVWTAASHSGTVTAYNGGGSSSTPIDTINLVFAPTQLDDTGVAAGIQGYLGGTGPANKTFNSGNTLGLGFTAEKFEAGKVFVKIGDTLTEITGCLLATTNVIVGTDSANTLNGTGAADLILALGGNDTVNAGGGNDCVFGNDGNDDITGGDGIDTIYAGSGDDVIRLNAAEGASDIVDGGDGNDTVQGNGGNDLVFENFGANNQYVNFEVLTNTNGTNTRAAVGNANANILNFDGVALTVSRIDGQGGNDTITASDVTPNVLYQGGTGDDTLTGQGLADNLQGGDGADSISGGDGDDTISGGTQQSPTNPVDVIDAGGGNDLITLNQRDGEFDTVNGGSGNDTVAGNGGNDLFFNNFGANDQYINIEVLTNVTRGAFGNDTVNELNMSGVALTVNKVGGLGGDDTVTTGASHTLRTDYDGGNGTDRITLKLSAGDYGAVIAANQLTALNNYVAAPTGQVLNLSALDFTARNFESAALNLDFDVLRVATVLDATDTTPENNNVTVPQGGTGNPTSVIQSTPTDNGTDRFSAYLDTNKDGTWNPGETREDLATFGNGTAMTAITTAPVDDLVGIAFVGGSVSGNQFFVGVGNGGHVNGTEKIVFTLNGGETAGAGEITIRGPVSTNPQNNPLADIAAGTVFDVFMFNDTGNGVRDSGEDVANVTFTVGSAQQSFTSLFAASGGATFNGIEIAANTNAFTLDNVEFLLA